MLEFRSIVDMRTYRKQLDPKLRVGFVPTMGALHDGHAELMRRLRPHCDRLVLSIFVNPTQFGPNEDLSRYPRTLEADLALARECGVDAVFFPTPEQMYPAGYSTSVEETVLTQRLCGEFRPGHFRGVTTVVLKLFNLVRPDIAYFGLKDAQQFFVLSKMAQDLNLDISVVGVPTVRESDGLAMSSRNRYLSEADRRLAPELYRVLKEVALELDAGEPLEETLAAARETLASRQFTVQYLECLSLPHLQPLSGPFLTAQTPALLAVAAQLGSTRFIDNVLLRPEGLGSAVQILGD